MYRLLRSRETQRGQSAELATSPAERGQVVLLVVLVIAVVITVGLSVAARSVINLRLATEEDQAERAFSAAEAGLDQSLLSDAGISSASLPNNASYSSSITSVRGTNLLMNNGKIVVQDQGSDIWLSEYSDNPAQNYQNPWSGTLTVFWGSGTDVCNSSQNVNTMAALEVILISGSRNNPIATHYAYDPCGSRRSQNNFSSPGGGGNVNGTNFSYSMTFNVTDGLLARVVPLYANTFVGVRGNPGLPVQGELVESTGTAGDIKRKVSVMRENPQLPVEFFTYTFFWPQ